MRRLGSDKLVSEPKLGPLKWALAKLLVAQTTSEWSRCVLHLSITVSPTGCWETPPHDLSTFHLRGRAGHCPG